MRALIIIDIQNDFLPGGALPVPQGDEIIPIVNALMTKDFDVIIATRDWHPKDHHSFAPRHNKQPGEIAVVAGLEQILWPIHCVQGSAGAQFPDALNTDPIEVIFYKGTDPNVDSYSAFFDNAKRHSTGLADYLKERSIKELFLVGLATDYCVKYSAIDAATLGFTTHVIIDACRAVELKKGDGERAIQEMKDAGVHILTTRNLL